jgi:glycosyltransferase involved in cell wall biosynthesis
MNRDTPRIVYLVSKYPALNHTFILREIRGLRALGFDIQVVAIRGDHRPAERLTADEKDEQKRTITVLPAGRHVLTAHLAALFSHPGGYFRGLVLACRMGGWHMKAILYHLLYFAEAVVAGQAAAKRGYRHVHTHFSSTVAMIAARIFGFDLSITLHGPDEFRDVVMFRMREKVACAKFISTISYYARSQIMQASDPRDWGKIEVCRLGVDPAVFAPAPAREGGGAEGFHIICVARLATVKAQRLLIAACARLAAAGWNLHLHLVGTGPDREDLRKFAAGQGIAGRVIFEGGKNQEEVIELYRKSDVFALASFAEGIPVALMEAMAMEIPCVATWVNGVPELILHQQEGLLSAPSDVEGMAGAIEMLLRDPDLRRRLGAAGRQKVLREYNLEPNIGKLAGVFQKYLS